MSKSLAAPVTTLASLMAEAMSPRLARFGISEPVFDLISALAAFRTGASQAELCARLGISAPALSETVRSAERQGLIERRRSNTDRRANHLTLSIAGWNTFRALREDLAQIEIAAGRGISPADLDATMRTLRALNGNLAKYIHTPLPISRQTA